MREPSEVVLCEICSKPMVEGQEFYAGIAHWDCKFPHGYEDPAVAAEKALKNLRTRIDNLEVLIRSKK